MSNRLAIYPSDLKLTDPREVRAKIRAAEEKASHNNRLVSVASRYRDWQQKLARLEKRSDASLSGASEAIAALDKEREMILGYESQRLFDGIVYQPKKREVDDTGNVDAVSLYRLHYASAGFGLRPMAKILEEIADLHNVTVADLKGFRRTRHICTARQHAYYAIVTERPDFSYPHIARHMGGRDHTTAMYGAGIFAERYGLPPVVRS